MAIADAVEAFKEDSRCKISRGFASETAPEFADLDKSLGSGFGFIHVLRAAEVLKLLQDGVVVGDRQHNRTPPPFGVHYELGS
jgi:hypothetical protein